MLLNIRKRAVTFSEKANVLDWTKEFRSISSHYNEWLKDFYTGRRRYKLLLWTFYVNRPWGFYYTLMHSLGLTTVEIRATRTSVVLQSWIPPSNCNLHRQLSCFVEKHSLLLFLWVITSREFSNYLSSKQVLSVYLIWIVIC